MSDEEYEEVEEEEEVEESNNPEQAQPQVADPQQKNTNIIGQTKAEDKKSDKKSLQSKESKSKHSSKKNKDSADNHSSKKKATSKVNKSKNTNDNTYKLPIPEQVVSTRAYLEQTVSSVIQEALLELARQRPDNPLEFVGNYILKKAKEK